jgi:hypothetical protein
MHLVRCTVPLYLAPGFELGEGRPVDAARIAALGAAVGSRCAAAAAAVAALTAAGWSCRAGRAELVLEKRCDRATAMLDFLRADLDPVALALHTIDAAG